MFCIKCGRKAVRNNFCEKCFLERNILFDIDNGIIYFCDMCGNYHSKKKKVDINYFIKSLMKTNNKITKICINKRNVGNRILIRAECHGKISNIEKKETKKSILTVKKHKCDDCIKISGNYYEAVIQARGEKTNKIIKTLENLSSPRIITNIEKVPTGYDIKITNKKKAANIVQILRQEFEVKPSYKLVGEKKGIKLYRNYYAVR